MKLTLKSAVAEIVLPLVITVALMLVNKTWCYESLTPYKTLLWQYYDLKIESYYVEVSNPAPCELPSCIFSSNPNVLELEWKWSLQDGISPGAGLETSVL